MKIALRIICLFTFIIILPNMSLASGAGDVIVYGVKIHLTNNIEIDGYAEIDYLLNSCHVSDFDKKNYKLESLETYWESIRTDSIIFYSKLTQIYSKKAENNFAFLAASRSSVKIIKVADIKTIKGVCKEYDGYNTVIVLITDYMAEYISHHKIIASYTFDHESVPEGDADYAYSAFTAYLSYNPKYPQQRLKKERKNIDKMSDDILDKNKLIRFTWTPG